MQGSWLLKRWNGGQTWPIMAEIPRMFDEEIWNLINNTPKDRNGLPGWYRWWPPMNPICQVVFPVPIVEGSKFCLPRCLLMLVREGWTGPLRLWIQSYTIPVQVLRKKTTRQQQTSRKSKAQGAVVPALIQKVKRWSNWSYLADGRSESSGEAPERCKNDEHSEPRR